MANDFDFTIENELAFKQGLDRLGKATNDFRIPFGLIALDFYRSQKAIFRLKGTGLYEPLGGLNHGSPSGFGSQTKRQRAEDEKERRTGHSWAPILFGESGDLRDSTISKNHAFSILFIGRQELAIGTSVPYGQFLQDGTKLMAQRKFIFITGGEGDKSRGSQIFGRRERWLDILFDHTLQLLSGGIVR